MSHSSIDHVAVRIAFEIALTQHGGKEAELVMKDASRLRRILFDLIERHEVQKARSEDALIGPSVRSRARRVYRELTSRNPSRERIAALILPGQTAVTAEQSTYENYVGSWLASPETFTLLVAIAGEGSGILQVDG